MSSFTPPSTIYFNVGETYTIDFDQYIIGDVQNIRWTHYYGVSGAQGGTGNFTGNHGNADDKSLQVYYTIDGVEAQFVIVLRSN